MVLTNKDKYLKDEVDVEEFLNEVIEHCSKSAKNSIETFLRSDVKPTLSEDEKVILRHRPLDHEYIGKDNFGLYISQWDNRAGSYCYWEFSNAFDFIKERRRI